MRQPEPADNPLLFVTIPIAVLFLLLLIQGCASSYDEADRKALKSGKPASGHVMAAPLTKLSDVDSTKLTRSSFGGAVEFNRHIVPVQYSGEELWVIARGKE